jgi:dTDP-4-amino-4,6-dideoxygalactose transaminase
VVAVLDGHPDVAIVEDNAHGLFGAVGERPLGSIGRFATQSFHETKNFSCGEGGALLVNDPADIDRARVLHEKGTNRRAFMLGQVDKYTWVDTGSSFGLSDALAAFLLGQLEQREGVQQRRRALVERYAAALAPHADALGLTLPATPPGHTSAAHLFHVLLPSREVRDDVLARMHEAGVNAVFHYVPLHDSVAGRRFAGFESACPVSVDVSGRLLRLPFFTTLTEADADRVVEVFLASARAALAGGAR